MFLKTLILRRKGEAIRTIVFRKGLNLVLDLTTEAPTDSGNNVGKTTFLRVVDFCLGSNGKSIYEDPEFKQQHNDTVYRYLMEQDVEFELTLEHASKTIVIVRSFTKNPKINGEEFSEVAFRERLGRELFGLRSAKPTFRQLIGKFIRIAPSQIANTVYYLHPSTSRQEYEAIYLFLFGFQDHRLLDARRSLLLTLKKLNSKSETLTSMFSQASLRQILAVYDRDIAALRKKEESFEVGNAVANQIGALESLRSSIAALSIELGNAGLRLRLNRDAIDRLERTASDIDADTIQEIYREAEIEIPSLSRKFSDVVAFHNKMIGNKIRFVRKSIDRLEREVTEKRSELDALTTKEQSLLKDVSKKGALVDLHKLHVELEGLTSQRAHKAALLTELEQITKEIEKAKTDLSDVNEQILAYRNELDKRIKEFNLIFSDFSRRLYKDEYVLALDTDEKGSKLFDITISNIRGNEGAGKKRAQISAFDLAYLKMLADQKSTSVRFTLHDRIEDVAINQLRTLFEIADEIDGQYVVAVLKDKLESLDNAWLEERTILSLSQDDRFFKIS